MAPYRGDVPGTTGRIGVSGSLRTHMKRLVKALQFLCMAGDVFWLLILYLGGLPGHACAEP